MEFIGDYFEKVTDEVQNFIDNDEWDKAEKLLLKNTTLFPDEWWLFAKLSQANKGKRDYEKAYEYAKKAMEINPHDHICMHEYADALLRRDETEEGIKLIKKILKKGLNELAYGKYGDGLMYAKATINDCTALLGYAYFDLKDNKKAKYYFRKHLRNRRRGIYSDFSKMQINKALKECD
ncbi:MAG: hypothetical protein LBL74_01595 [Bacteroidales bacterium]|jgi:tetratricopeptide (TPR) repeat protein|nr:hypothetical protein [Bacteroidales bacterium]